MERGQNSNSLSHLPGHPRGIGTSLNRLPKVHWAVPSPSLDKSIYTFNYPMASNSLSNPLQYFQEK